MKKILLLLTISMSLHAQQSILRLPRDGANAPMSHGMGLPYGFVLTPTTDAYDNSIRYQLPSTGNDTNRVYRHISVYNPSASRTLYICFGGSSGCTGDNIIVPPSVALVYEPIRFGKSVDTEYVYVRLDSAATVAVTFGVW
jgi:hypothetical protein